MIDLVHSGWTESGLADFAKECERVGVALHPEMDAVTAVVKDGQKARSAVMRMDHAALAAYV